LGGQNKRGRFKISMSVLCLKQVDSLLISMRLVLCMLFFGSFRYNSTTIDNTHHANQETYKDCEILIYSPYDCYNDIKLYKSGLGFFSTGRQYEDSSAGDKNKNDSLMNRIPFNINSEEEGMRITKLILYIKSRDKQTSHRIFDAFHFVLKIDGVKYIDVYGDDKQVNELLRIMLKYFEKKIDDKCGFFKLFKKIK
jgi:hypothetical protein